MTRMVIESWHDNGEKSRWRIVRTDDYSDVPGEILSANEQTGDCILLVGGEPKSLRFGSGGIRITGRRK